MPLSIQSMGASAQLNTAWNIRNITSASTSMPLMGCNSSASRRWPIRLSGGAR